MADQRKKTPQKAQAQDSKPHEGELQGDERIDALMPWIKRSDLQNEDSDLVSEELANSAEFRGKLAQESDLEAALEAIAADEATHSAGDADAAWAKFKARLPDKPAAETSLPVAEDAPPQPHPLPLEQRQPRASGAPRTSAWRRFRLPQTGVGWLATAQTAVLAALAFAFIPGQIEPQEDEYRLLSSDELAAQPSQGNVVIILDPTSDQATLKALLAQVDARIVDGPMENGGYVLSLEADNLEAGLVTLEASEAVVMVQPLSIAEAP